MTKHRQNHAQAQGGRVASTTAGGRRDGRLACLAAGLVGLLSAALLGCSTSGSPGGGTTPPTPTAFLTGNWVFTATPTTSEVPFTGLSGFLYAQYPGVEDATTASLQATLPAGTGCYSGAALVPLYGSLTGQPSAYALSIRSLYVNGQALQITATANATLDQLTGSYTIQGGCANGAAGNVAGVRYSNLTGLYQGHFTNDPSETLSLTLKQNTPVDGTGNGTFLVGGTGIFHGFSCFSAASIPAPSTSVAASTIVGDAVDLTFAEPDASQMHLAGTIDQKADTLTLTSGTITGGSCAAALGSATLTLQ